MQVLRRNKRQPSSGQGFSGPVHGIVLVKVIQKQLRHKTLLDYVLFRHKVFQDVRRMFPSFLNLWASTLMLGANVLHMTRKLQELAQAVIRLPHNTLAGLSYVVLKANNVFKPQTFPHIS